MDSDSCSLKNESNVIFIFSVNRCFKNLIKNYGFNKRLEKNSQERNLLLATFYEQLLLSKVSGDYTDFRQSFASVLNNVNKEMYLVYRDCVDNKTVQYMANSCFRLMKNVYDEKNEMGKNCFYATGYTYSDFYNAFDEFEEEATNS